jgi:hypothetical protein
VIDDPSLLLSTNILSMAVLDLFCIRVAKFTVCDRLYVVNNEESSFFRLLSERMTCNND